MLATLVLLKIFSSRTQPVRALSTPSVRKSDATPVTPDNSRMSAPVLTIRMSLRPLRVSRTAVIARKSQNRAGP